MTHTSTTMAEDVAVILANIRATQDEHRARPGPFRSILRETPACTHTGNAGGSSDHARIVPHPRVS